MTNQPGRIAPDVPREFVGLARLFCARMDAAAKAAGGAARQFVADARTIIERRPTWRPEHFPGFERQWRRTMPDEGRIGLEIEREKRTLIIGECRLARASYEDIRWSESSPEVSLVLMLYTFRLTTPSAFESQRLAIAGLGLHAMARRYQRGFDNTDGAILRDISELAVKAPILLGTDGPTFTVPCPSGVWVGAIETARLSNGPDQRLLNVRSFLHRY